MDGGSIIKIIEKTLNYVDPRLIDHGKRVAYTTYRLMKRQGKYDDEQIRKTVTLALLHDIGAYKTDEISEMIQFETAEAREHSVYGYLFIKNFSPLSDLAEIILHHHTDYASLRDADPYMREQAQIVFIADRTDILIHTTGADTVLAHFEARRGTIFDSALLDAAFSDGGADLFAATAGEMEADRAFLHALYHQTLSPSERDAYIRMIVLIIDFRSEQTVTHTFTVASACRFLSEFLDLDPAEKDCLYSGAMLHDLGKISTPVEILNKRGPLTEEEMTTMRRHVLVTGEILSGNVTDCATRLSARHHERLDGSGYPEGLAAGDLTVGQRLVAVADVFSALCGIRSYKDAFPKESVLQILTDMSARGQLDPAIVSAVADQYDALAVRIKAAVAPIIDTYEEMRREYDALLGEQPPGAVPGSSTQP